MDYDPHVYREVKRPISNSIALLCLLNSSMGLGVVSMPSSFKYSGYVGGVILSLICGVIVLYGVNVLFNTMYVVCQRKRVAHLSIPLAMEIALATGPPSFRFLSRFAWCTVNAVIVMYHFGICSLYVVFVAENIRNILFTGAPAQFDLRFFMLAAFIPLLLVFTIPTMKWITPLSVIGGVLQVIAMILLFFLISIHDDSKAVRNEYASVTKFPLLYGTVVYSMESIGMLMEIEANMKTPKSFHGPAGVLNVLVTAIILINLVCGFWGYWKFGESVKPSITMNLPENFLGQVTKALFTFSILVSYNLQGYVIMDVVFTRHISGYVEDYEIEKYEFSVRVFVSMLSVFFAMTIPEILNFLQLLGALWLTFLGIILPSAMEICVKYPNEYGPGKIVLIRDFAILVFGIVCGVAAILTSVFWSITSYSDQGTVDYFGRVAD